MIARALTWLTWLIRFVDRVYGLPACRKCGCTEHAACNDGCSWIERDLCSTCADPAQVLDDMCALGYPV